MATSILNPEFRYYSETVTIDATNNILQFEEVNTVNLTATLTSGTYFWAELAYEIKRALEAASTGPATYTVSYSHSTRKYTIVSDRGAADTLIFDIETSGVSNTGWPTLGFTGDTSGTVAATSVTQLSDTAVPSQTTFSMTASVWTRVRRPQQRNTSALEVTMLESGRRASTYHGDIDRLTFAFECLTVTDIQGLRDLWDKAGKFGNAIDFYPDETNNTDYVTVYWDATEFPPVEMTASKLYRLYALEMTLHFKVPAAGTVTARGLLDRGPS
jgi:hypothetical protein